jgi:hypothetical protein
VQQQVQLFTWSIAAWHTANMSLAAAAASLKHRSPIACRTLTCAESHQQPAEKFASDSCCSDVGQQQQQHHDRRICCSKVCTVSDAACSSTSARPMVTATAASCDASSRA